jgi:hypothetical protein
VDESPLDLEMAEGAAEEKSRLGTACWPDKERSPVPWVVLLFGRIKRIWTVEPAFAEIIARTSWIGRQLTGTASTASNMS